MSQCFSKPYERSRGNVKVELDLFDYIRKKTDLKRETGVNILDLDIVKSDVDKLDIDKLVNVPGGLNSLKSKVNNLMMIR